MYATGFSDSIWHFLGYLRLDEDVAHLDKLYEGDAFRTITLDLTVHLPAPLRPNLDVDDLSSLPSHWLLNTAPLEDALHLTRLRPPVETEEIEGLLGLPYRPSATFAVQGSPFAGSLFGSLPHEIEVTYENGAMQVLLKLTQANRMLDDDLVTSSEIIFRDGAQWTLARGPVDPLPVLADLVQAANTFTRDDLKLSPSADTQEILTFFDNRHQAWKDGSLSSAEPVEPGRYVNGVRSDAEVEKASPTPVVEGIANAGWTTSADGSVTRTINGPSDGIGTVAETGGNNAVNALAIKDLTALNGSMIIAGDVFHSNVIVQVNILTDNDNVDLIIGPDVGSIGRIALGGGNATHNIAEFVHHDFSTIYRGAAFADSWKVDVVNGDFYSIRALTQTNFLIDDDRVSQFSDRTFYQLRTGNNEQVNLADLYHANDYDIIIVGGSWHGANWIFQKNVVVDSDWVAARFDGAGGGNQIAFAGGNSLINEAKITTYGSDEYRPMNEAQHGLVELLRAGDTTLVGNPDWQLTGSSSGELKVLFINGDFYNLNLISQMNVMADIDQLAQWTRSGGEATQGALTGGNTAYNYAHIIEAGTMSGSCFVGGQAYEDSILIQGEIITDQDEISIQLQGYVPELVAFVDQIVAPEDCLVPAATKVSDPSLYDNPGNVMN